MPCSARHRRMLVKYHFPFPIVAAHEGAMLSKLRKRASHSARLLLRCLGGVAQAICPGAACAAPDLGPSMEASVQRIASGLSDERAGVLPQRKLSAGSDVNPTSKGPLCCASKSCPLLLFYLWHVGHDGWGFTLWFFTCRVCAGIK